MLDICLLLVQQGSSDLVDVIEQCLSLDRAIQLWMLVLQCSPILLSDDVATACCESLVNKEAPLVKASFKPTDHSLARVSHFEMNLLIDFITDIVEPMLDENDLIDVIQLCEEKLGFIIMNWLQILQDFDHEFLVLEIGPGVIAVSIWALIIGNAEVPSEVLQEAFEQEVCIDCSLDFDGKLLD